MATDVVTFLYHAVDNVPMLLCVPAQHEKRSPRFAGPEQIEELRGDRSAGTVVIGQSERPFLDYFSS
jgi:hypothetical protein